MSKQVDLAFNLLGGIAAVLVVGFIAISVISQFQDRATTANGTETNIPAAGTQPEEPLIAFVMRQADGNHEIYTMKSNGSDLTNITNNPASDESPAWSPDGTQIAFISERTGNADIFIMNFDGNELTQLTNNSGYDGFFSWSPDGEKIIYLTGKADINRDGQLVVMNTDGSNKTFLTEPGSYIFLDWSPDGQKIVYQKQNLDEGVQANELYIMNIDGTQKQFWNSIIDGITWTGNQNFLGYGWDGNGENSRWVLQNFNINGEPPAVIASHSSPIVALFEDTYVVESTNALTLYPLDGNTTPLQSYDLRQVCGQSGDNFFQETGHATSPGGRWAFVNGYCPSGKRYFLLESTDGSHFVQLTDFFLVEPLTASDYNWSPDERFVIATISDTMGQDIYRFDIPEMLSDPSTQPVQLTNDGAIKYGAVWQPVIHENLTQSEPTPQPDPITSDKPLLAFAMEQDGNSDIYTLHADGSGLTNLTNNPAQDMNPVWSPDGKRIAFQSDREGFMQIFLMSADGSNVTQLTDNQADHALTLNMDGEANPWSPDGTKMTVLERAVGEELWNFYVLNINSGNKVLLGSGRILFNSVSWSPDGKFLGYTLNTSESIASFKSEIHIVESDGNNPVRLQALVPQDEDLDSNYYWSPNEQAVVFTTSKNQNNPARQVFLYEYDLQTGALSQKTTFQPELLNWQENLYLFLRSNEFGEVSFIWQRPDGATHTFGWDASCWEFDVTRSDQGNFAIGASCPDQHFRLYWANADGSEVKQILDMSMEAAISGMGDITWSPDDQYVALHIATVSKTSLYILNVAEALANPSLQPVEVLIGGGEQYFHPAWQPLP